MHRKRRSTAGIAVALLAAAGLTHADEPATLSSKLKDMNLRVYGFVEADYVSDDTQGLFEELANNLVAHPGTYAGEHRSNKGSIQNSRLGFDVTFPKSDSGLLAEGILEFDLLGNQTADSKPGSKAGNETERDYFNNASVRVRHAYANLTTDSGWNFKLGQTWSLLGWQPYYFPSEPIVLATPGLFYRRFVQARGSYTAKLGDSTLETAADVAKPAEMNSGLPEAHAGVRWASTQSKAAMVAGSGSAMNGLSLGLSGAWIPVRSDMGNSDGWAGAVDLFVPIIASPDGKDKSNNLSLTAEFGVGNGIGGLELSGLNFGFSAPATATGLDSGIGAVNSSGAFEFIQARIARANLTYFLPNPKWATSVGYSQTEGLNLADFTTTASGFADTIRYYYATVMYDPLPYLRFAGEYSNVVDTYLDGIHAVNNRVWLTSYFIF